MASNTKSSTLQILSNRFYYDLDLLNYTKLPPECKTSILGPLAVNPSFLFGRQLPVTLQPSLQLERKEPILLLMGMQLARLFRKRIRKTSTISVTGRVGPLDQSPALFTQCVRNPPRRLRRCTLQGWRDTLGSRRGCKVSIKIDIGTRPATCQSCRCSFVA